VELREKFGLQLDRTKKDWRLSQGRKTKGETSEGVRERSSVERGKGEFNLHPSSKLSNKKGIRKGCPVKGPFA